MTVVDNLLNQKRSIIAAIQAEMAQAWDQLGSFRWILMQSNSFPVQAESSDTDLADLSGDLHFLFRPMDHVH